MLPPIDWQQAVSSLMAERGRAVTATGLIRARGSVAQIDAAALDYGEGKAETDAVIAALLVALEAGAEAEAPATLDARLALAVAARQRLARTALALSEGADTTRSGLLDLAVEALPHLAAAIAALWVAAQGKAARRRTTVAVQLAAAVWPPFHEIPAP